jgi:hypothetical protein
MTPGTDPSPVIAGVLDTLRQARSLLLDPSPRNIDACRLSIFQCVHKLVTAMEGDRADWPKKELTNLLLEMRSELSAISDLLDSAATFRRNMLIHAPRSTRTLAMDIDPAVTQTVGHVHVLG